MGRAQRFFPETDAEFLHVASGNQHALVRPAGFPLPGKAVPQSCERSAYQISFKANWSWRFAVAVLFMLLKSPICDVVSEPTGDLPVGSY
jgi:hypothetical protein